MANSGTIASLSAADIANSAFGADVESFGSFSGTNIVAHINHVSIGTLMGVSYTIHSEKQAQYTFGSPNPRRFTTGKRGIAGTLIFNTFDRSPVISIFTGSNQSGQSILSYASNPTSPFNKYASQFIRYNDTGTIVPGGIAAQAPLTYSGIAGATDTFNAGLASDVRDAYANVFLQPLEYADQLPPFDITLTMTDNLGNGAYMVIGGIEILNEGGGFTIDDLTNQTAYTYVARYIRPLTPITPNGAPATAVGAVHAAGNTSAK